MKMSEDRFITTESPKSRRRRINEILMKQTIEQLKDLKLLGLLDAWQE
jgi:hypothetical protein